MNEESGAPDLVSNIEVMEFLQKRLEERTTQRHSLRHRDWIEDKVVEYIKSTPAVRLDSSRRQELQSILRRPSKRNGVVKSNSGFGLTEAESLQIVNCMPTEPVEIHLMVEDLQSRLTERQQDDILVLVGSYVKKEQLPTTSDEMLRDISETNGYHNVNATSTTVRSPEEKAQNGLKQEIMETDEM
jgi:hypothetical protein